MRILRPVLICAVIAGAAGALLLRTEVPARNAPTPVGDPSAYEALAKRQGEAYAQAVAFEQAGAAWSGQMRAGAALITVTLRSPEASWQRAKDGRLALVEPIQGTVHLRAFIADAADGRFVPGLSVHARFFDAQGQSMGSEDLPFGLYPLTDAYGANVTLPPDAAALAIYVDTLTVSRDDDQSDEDDSFDRPIRAQFALRGIGPITGETASARAEAAPEALLLAQTEAQNAARVALGEGAAAAGETNQGEVLLDYAVAAADTRLSQAALRSLKGDTDQEQIVRLDIVARDAATGRFLPGLKVTATVESFDGTALRQLSLPLRWSPWLHRYAENGPVPRAKPYQLRVEITPPEAPRYGAKADHWVDQPVSVVITPQGMQTTQN